jgi:hypothetical protein
VSAGLSSSCAYVEKAAFKSVDAAVAYCEANTPQGRAAVREQIAPAAKAADVAVGLRCPGDDKMYVIGDPKTVVTDQ